MKSVLICLVAIALAIAGVLWLVDSSWIVKYMSAVEHALKTGVGRW